MSPFSSLRQYDVIMLVLELLVLSSQSIITAESIFNCDDAYQCAQREHQASPARKPWVQKFAPLVVGEL